METLAELQTQLLLVNTAIQKLIAGDTLVEFEVGSGSSARRYKKGEVNLTMLNTEKARILSGIQSLTASEPTYRTSSHMQTVYRKI